MEIARAMQLARGLPDEIERLRILLRCQIVKEHKLEQLRIQYQIQCNKLVAIRAILNEETADAAGGE